MKAKEILDNPKLMNNIRHDIEQGKGRHYLVKKYGLTEYMAQKIISGHNELLYTTKQLVGDVLEDKFSVDMSVWIKTEKTPASVLSMFGYDATKWKLKDVRNMQNGTQAMVYAKVEPILPDGVELDDLFKGIEVNKIKLKKINKANKQTYVIPMYDFHFGKLTQTEIDDLYTFYINHMPKNSNVFIINGGDMLEVDNKQMTTTKGTQLEQIDLVGAWQSAYNFITGLIEHANKQGNKVKVAYTNGNHDDTLGMLLMKTVSMSMGIEIDLNDGIKLFELADDNILVLDHGVNKIADYTGFLLENFPKQISKLLDKSARSYVFIGHLHYEEVKHKWATIWRLPSPTPPNEYTKSKALYSKRGVTAFNFNGKEITRIGYDL